MRYLLVFLLLVPTAFAFYDGDTATFEGQNYTFTLYHKESSAVAAKVSEYSRAERAGDEGLMDGLADDLRYAINLSKQQDRVHVQSGNSSVLLSYNGCQPLAGHTLCFTKIVYYEEDASPLGNNRLDEVEYANGTMLLPFTVTFDKAPVSSVVAKRSLNATTVYPYDDVKVTLTLSNSGSDSSGRLSITDSSNASLRSGEPVLQTASLPAGEKRQAFYILEPREPGVYTISAVTEGATLADSKLTVLSPLNITITTNASYNNEPAAIMVNVSNTYRADLKLSGSISSSTQLPSCTLTSTPQGVTSRSFSFTLEQGKYLLFNCSIQPSAGNHTFDIRLRAQEINEQEKELEFAVIKRDLGISASASNSTLTLSFNNTLQRRIEGISVDYGDGSKESLFLKPESSVKLAHRYTVAQASVKVTYEGQVKEFPIELQSTGPLVLNQSAETPSQPTTQPAVQPDTPPAPPQDKPKEVGTPKDERGFVTRFLDWLDGLFH